MLRTALIAGLGLAAASCATTPPSFDAADATAFDAFYEAKVADGERAGYVVGVMVDDHVAFETAYGMKDIAAGAPMTLDTRFRIASMTKPVTSVGAMILVEDGKLGLDDPVSDYIPEFADAKVATSPMANPDGSFTLVDAEPMTVRHLLTHTSGLGYIFDFETDLGKRNIGLGLYEGDGDLEARVKAIASLPLYFQPGERWSYSWSDDVLGRVIEVASGQPFEDFLAEEIFEPLDMTATGFFPTDDEVPLFAAIYTHDETGALVTDDTFGANVVPSWPSGGGGLASTLDDYMRFAHMLENGGVLDGARILKAETVAEMSSPQVTPEQLPASFAGMSYGFGVGVTTDAEASRYEGDVDGDYYWGGYFDTVFFISPERDAVAVLMTQNQPTPTSRQTDTSGDFHRLVSSALAAPETE